MNAIDKIYNHLLLNATYLTDYGLYEGKTGCLLFFAHYAKQHGDEVNDEVVSNLIDDIFANVSCMPAYDLKHGVCGIGWAVEYLLQNHLQEGNSDEILFDLDNRIVKNGINNQIPQADVTGIIKYVATRLTSPCGCTTNNIPYPPAFLQDLYYIATGEDLNTDAGNDLSVIGKVLQSGRYQEKRAILSPDMTGSASMEKFPHIFLSLHNGLSGLGIKLLLNE